MGSGKTSAAIELMNNDFENNYIFITPYLAEVQRIKEKCINKKFYEPENKGLGKLDSLNKLLSRECSIASTHALFKTATDYTKELIRLNNYILILDEVCDVVEHVPIHKDDLKNILTTYAHIEDNFLVWDDMTYEGDKFNDIKVMALNKNLIVVNDNLLMWNFPVNVFNSFKEIYILTYMFNSQLQKYYYDYYNVEYEYIGVNYYNNKYNFSDSFIIPDYVKTLKNKIHIYDDDNINCIGDNEYALSVSWYKKDQDKNKLLMKKLKNNVSNYFKNKVKASSKDIMWTTFKDYYKKLTGKGYTKGFVSFNARATNEYADRKYLAYCVNVFINPILGQFFNLKNIDIDEDGYALSEMIQWIWRSAIRKGEDIYIYIPSSRMRNLLKEWLNILCVK